MFGKVKFNAHIPVSVGGNSKRSKECGEVKEEVA
jgi:hypothetical protein